MASKLAPQSLCGHSSTEDSFEIGGAGGKGRCAKVRWNTVRQGEIWINGLFCEQEFYMSNGNYESINSPGSCESCINGHSEADWISNQIAFQEIICGESSSDVSDLQTVEAEFPRDEHDLDILSTFTAVAALFGEWCSLETEFSDSLDNEGVEKYGKLKKDKAREWAFIDNVRSGSKKVMDGFDTLSTQNTNWSDGDYEWNGFKNEFWEDQYRLCRAFIDRGFVAGEPLRIFEGDLQNNWLPDMAAQKLSQEDTRSWQKHIRGDICRRSTLEEVLQGKQSYRPQCDKGQAERDCNCNEHKIGSASLLLSVENQREGMRLFEDMDFVSSHALYLDRKSSASRYGFVSEGEARLSSGAGALLPLTGTGQNRSAEAEEDLLMADVTFRGDGFGSPEGRTESGTAPADAFFYALSYMGLKEILSLERVCKSFREWVRGDILLWQQLHVEPPLSKSFTDEALLQLVSRSKGQLRCLSLVDCLRVTEAAVEQVVYSNPRISKLCLPGCSRISPEAVVRMVKTLTDCSAGKPYLKQLRVRNIYGLTSEHLNSLKTMLGEDEQVIFGSRKPQFYHNGHYSFFCDDQRPIDVETCPKCSNVRLVYDCTRERCQQKRDNKFRECRACILCIVRCEECGRCINDNEYEETFCLDLLCSSCWLRLPKCSECNRPGCGRHADHFIRTPETTFICSDCCGSSPGPSGPEFHVYA